MGGRRIPHDLRVELYYLVRELHDRGVSYREIQRIVEEEYGLRISRSNISYWVRGLHSPLNEPYNRPNLDARELSWIAGMLAGDGSIKVNRKGRFLTLKVKDRELAEVAARKLAVVMGRDRPYAVNRLGDGRYYVQVQSRELVDHLSVRENIFLHLEKNPREFIQAFSDCEGSITGSINSDGRFSYLLSVVNTDVELLESISEALVGLGILSKIYLQFPAGFVIITSRGTTQARKNCYSLRIQDIESLTRYAKEINFVVRRKREKLGDIVRILSTYGTGVRASVEWIRRYMYVRGEGRERWVRRDTTLTLESAERALHNHLLNLASRRRK
ncbi:MAG: hypothetical protein DRO01_00160 [Thermoproteota archaeon]|nr:MAG: hypothetical protein DRO01_00160 [Candidatus Korarchaeota archaeon]